MRMEIIGLAAVAMLLLLVIIGFVIRAIMQRQYEKALIDYQNNISPSICHICSLLYPLIRQISRACSLYSKSRSNEKQKKNIFNHPPSLDARPN